MVGCARVLLNTFRCDRTKGARTRIRMFGGAFPVTVELWHVINGGTVIHFPFQRHYAQLHHSSGYVACEQPVQVWTIHLSLPRCETLSTTSVTRPQSSILIDSPCATRSELEGLGSRAPWERCVFGFKSFVVLQPAPTLIPRFFATYCIKSMWLQAPRNLQAGFARRGVFPSHSDSNILSNSLQPQREYR